MQYKDKVTGEMKETEVVSYWDFLQEYYPLDTSDQAANEQNRLI